jgi:hypothetical protein
MKEQYTTKERAISFILRFLAPNCQLVRVKGKGLQKMEKKVVKTPPEVENYDLPPPVTWKDATIRLTVKDYVENTLID